MNQQVATRGQLCTAFGLKAVGTGELWKVSDQESGLVSVCIRKIILAARLRRVDETQKVRSGTTAVT